MADKKKRAVIITGPNFQDEEFIYPYYRFLEEGFTLDVAVKDKATVHGKYGVPCRPTVDTKDRLLKCLCIFFTVGVIEHFGILVRLSSANSFKGYYLFCL